MGYYVTLESSNCYLTAEHKEEAYKRLCELNNHNDFKRGGSFGAVEPTASVGTEDRPAPPHNAPREDRWFSWCEWNYQEICKDAEAILQMIGFETDASNGDIHIYSYDSKTGQEDLFLATICDLLIGEMEWRGEDGNQWMFRYGGEKPQRFYAQTTWIEEDQS